MTRKKNMPKKTLSKRQRRIADRTKLMEDLIKEVAGDPKPDKSLDSELKDVKKTLEELTSDIPAVDANNPKRPRPALSPLGRRAARRERIAELKKALLEENTADGPDRPPRPSSSLDRPEPPAFQKPGGSLKKKPGASKSNRQNAFKAYQLLKSKIPALFGKEAKELNSANDQLEDAIMSNDQGKIQAALAMLLQQVQSKSQAKMKEMSALGKTIRLVHKKMQPRMASSTKTATRYAFVNTHRKLVDKYDQELSRAEVLIRMAAKNVRL